MNESNFDFSKPENQKNNQLLEKEAIQNGNYDKITLTNGEESAIGANAKVNIEKVIGNGGTLIINEGAKVIIEILDNVGKVIVRKGAKLMVEQSSPDTVWDIEEGAICSR